MTHKLQINSKTHSIRFLVLLNPSLYHTRIKKSQSIPAVEIITEKDLDEALDSLNIKATAGKDKISNKMLKKCSTQMKNLLNASFKIGYIPQKWKTSMIIIIPKKGKPPEELSSYRPFTLTSCICKLLERIINKKLQNWLKENHYWPACQSGFHEKRSTQDHILRICQ